MPKPWLDLSKYREVRLRESLYEAERLLEQGLVGNAAGRAFQAWKALAAASTTSGYACFMFSRRRLEK